MYTEQIQVDGLGKSYGKVVALRDVSLRVGAGVVLGVLGHNGAGKTTLIDILATRTSPTAGRAVVCGWDVVTWGQQVRRHIGMAGQFVGLDDALSGRGNLVLLGRLLGASRRQARARADELLEALRLTELAGRRPGTYSGGMRRRLDLAASLIGRPEVLFLDEPSTGLDPVSRSDLWGIVEELARSGTTVVLTTQDLAEAERLADSIVVLAAGAVVTAGTPQQLTSRLGQRTATVSFADATAMHQAVGVLTRLGMGAAPREQECAVHTSLPAAGDVATLVRALDSGGLPIHNMTVTEPTLNDVYLSLYAAGWQS